MYVFVYLEKKEEFNNNNESYSNKWYLKQVKKGIE